MKTFYNACLSAKYFHKNLPNRDVVTVPVLASSPEEAIDKAKSEYGELLYGVVKNGHPFWLKKPGLLKNYDKDYWNK